jgi:diguanylate cyclase (GGDEF)-like protein
MHSADTLQVAQGAVAFAAGMDERNGGSQPLEENRSELEYTDKATGLGNALRLKEKFKTLQDRYNLASEGEARAFSIGFVNLDGMKPINDLFGRDGGDRLIEQCSMRLRAAVEPFGFVFRGKGDEFAFVLPGIGDKEQLNKTARLLQEVLVAPFDIDGSSVRLSGSFGFAVYPEAGDTLGKITACIETALYHSKRQGRGRLTIYSPEIDKMVRENAIIEQALRKAISEDNIAPHYQPIVSRICFSGKVHSARRRTRHHYPTDRSPASEIRPNCSRMAGRVVSFL